MSTRKAIVGLALLALPCMITVMDLTVLNLAVPHLSAALQPTGTQLLWIIDIYGFMLAGALIPIGSLGDRIGRRKLLLGAGDVGLGANDVETGRNTGGEPLLGVAQARQVFVQVQGASDRAGDLADFEGMGQPGAEVVALVLEEDLRLVLQPPEGRGMDAGTF